MIYLITNRRFRKCLSSRYGVLETLAALQNTENTEASGTIPVIMEVELNNLIPLFRETLPQPAKWKDLCRDHNITHHRAAAFLTRSLFCVRTGLGSTEAHHLAINQMSWCLEEEVKNFWNILRQHSDDRMFEGGFASLSVMYQAFYDASEREIQKMKSVTQYHCWTCDILLLNDGHTRRRCASCGVATYCSRFCQKQDWSRHRKVCGDRKEKQTSTVKENTAASSRETKM